MKIRKKKTVLVITGTRADYGLLRPVMYEILKSKTLALKVLATGMHTLDSGLTLKDIRRDKMPIGTIVPISANDSMLEALLDQLGFKGEGLGEKLKAASQGNFHGASMAWEPHAVRNMIAHEGSVFELSEHEAKRVIALYEGIFRQYGYI